MIFCVEGECKIDSGTVAVKEKLFEAPSREAAVKSAFDYITYALKQWEMSVGAGRIKGPSFLAVYGYHVSPQSTNGNIISDRTAEIFIWRVDESPPLPECIEEFTRQETHASFYTAYATYLGEGRHTRTRKTKDLEQEFSAVGVVHALESTLAWVMSRSDAGDVRDKRLMSVELWKKEVGHIHTLPPTRGQSETYQAKYFKWNVDDSLGFKDAIVAKQESQSATVSL